MSAAMDELAAALLGIPDVDYPSPDEAMPGPGGETFPSDSPNQQFEFTDPNVRAAVESRGWLPCVWVLPWQKKTGASLKRPGCDCEWECAVVPELLNPEWLEEMLRGWKGTGSTKPMVMFVCDCVGRVIE